MKKNIEDGLAESAASQKMRSLFDCTGLGPKDFPFCTEIWMALCELYTQGYLEAMGELHGENSEGGASRL